MTRVSKVTTINESANQACASGDHFECLNRACTCRCHSLHHLTVTQLMDVVVRLLEAGERAGAEIQACQFCPDCAKFTTMHKDGCAFKHLAAVIAGIKEK